MKPWYKSKSLWFGILTVALGIFQLVTKQFELSGDWVILTVGIINVLLRSFSTSQPLAFRTPPAMAAVMPKKLKK